MDPQEARKPEQQQQPVPAPKPRKLALLELEQKVAPNVAWGE